VWLGGAFEPGHRGPLAPISSGSSVPKGSNCSVTTLRIWEPHRMFTTRSATSEPDWPDNCRVCVAAKALLLSDNGQGLWRGGRCAREVITTFEVVSAAFLRSIGSACTKCSAPNKQRERQRFPPAPPYRERLGSRSPQSQESAPRHFLSSVAATRK
jgi:hypothetical protein